MKKYTILFKNIMKLQFHNIMKFFYTINQRPRQFNIKRIKEQIKDFKISTAGSFPGLILILALAVTILLLFGSVPIRAHELLIEGVAEGKVNASFDDGTPAIQVDISVYHEDELVYEGRTDRQGSMELPEGMQWDKIEARDNYGHRALYTGEEEDGFRLPRWAGALIGLSFLLLIAAFSGYRQK